MLRHLKNIQAPRSHQALRPWQLLNAMDPVVRALKSVGSPLHREPSKQWPEGELVFPESPQRSQPQHKKELGQRQMQQLPRMPAFWMHRRLWRHAETENLGWRVVSAAAPPAEAASGRHSLQAHEHVRSQMVKSRRDIGNSIPTAIVEHILVHIV